MILKILLLWAGLAGGRMVSRIVRTRHEAPLDYKGANFARLIDGEVRRLSSAPETFKLGLNRCIDRNIRNPRKAEARCVGYEFSRLDAAAELERVKADSAFEGLLDVAVNENCLCQAGPRNVCLVLLSDLKLLNSNGYDAIESVLENKTKYTNSDGIPAHVFTEILSFVKMATESIEPARKDFEDKMELSRAEVWQYFLEQKSKAEAEEKLYDSTQADQEGAVSTEIISDPAEMLAAMDEKFGNIAKEFREFVAKENINGIYPIIKEPDSVDLKAILDAHSSELKKLYTDQVDEETEDAQHDEDDEEEKYTRLLKKMKV